MHPCATRAASSCASQPVKEFPVSHKAVVLFAVLRKVPQLVPRRNINISISMHGTSITCWEYVPYYPTGTAHASLQILEYRLAH